MRPNRWCLLVSVATSIFFDFPPSANSALNNVPLDLAIIARVGYSDEVVENVKNVLDQLPDIFPFSRDKTRVAVLALAADWTTSTNLMESPLEYRRVVGEIEGFKGGNDLESPLKTIREKIFLDPKRPRVIILVNEGWTVSDGAMNEAAALRSSGVWFSVICQEVVEPAMDRLRRIADHFISFEFVVGLSTQFRASHLEEVKTKNDERLCAYNSSCFFTDDKQSGCTKDWWTPLALRDYGSCSDVATPPPPITRPCHRNECIETCDTWWPWQKPTPDCDPKCGKTSFGRVGTAGWKQLEFCPRLSECQECTTQAKTAGPTAAQRKKTNSLKLRPLQTGLIVALVIAVISVVAVVGMLWYRRKRRAGLKGLMLKYDQVGSDTEATFDSVATSGASFATRRSPLSPTSAVSARQSKAAFKGLHRLRGTKSSPSGKPRRSDKRSEL